jgi:hypothetical protein
VLEAEAERVAAQLRMFERIKNLYRLDFDAERRRLEARLDRLREAQHGSGRRAI